MLRRGIFVFIDHPVRHRGPAIAASITSPPSESEDPPALAIKRASDRSQAAAAGSAATRTRRDRASARQLDGIVRHVDGHGSSARPPPQAPRGMLGQRGQRRAAARNRKASAEKCVVDACTRRFRPMPCSTSSTTPMKPPDDTSTCSRRTNSSTDSVFWPRRKLAGSSSRHSLHPPAPCAKALSPPDAITRSASRAISMSAAIPLCVCRKITRRPGARRQPVHDVPPNAISKSSTVPA